MESNEFAESSMDVDDDSFERELYAVVQKVQGWDTIRKVAKICARVLVVLFSNSIL